MTPIEVIWIVVALAAASASVWSFSTSAGRRRADEARLEASTQDVLDRQADFDSLKAQLRVESRVAADPTVTDSIGVSDAVEVRLERANEPITRDDLDVAIAAINLTTAKLREDIDKATAKKPWSERFLLPIFLAVIAISPAAYVFLDDDRPDCNSYASALLAIHKQAATNAAAVNAANALTWHEVDDECGSPAQFIEPLGEPPPPGG